MGMKPTAQKATALWAEEFWRGDFSASSPSLFRPEGGGPFLPGV